MSRIWWSFEIVALLCVDSGPGPEPVSYVIEFILESTENSYEIIPKINSLLASGRNHPRTLITILYIIRFLLESEEIIRGLVA